MKTTVLKKWWWGQCGAAGSPTTWLTPAPAQASWWCTWEAASGGSSTRAMSPIWVTGRSSWTPSFGLVWSWFCRHMGWISGRKNFFCHITFQINKSQSKKRWSPETADRSWSQRLSRLDGRCEIRAESQKLLLFFVKWGTLHKAVWFNDVLWVSDGTECVKLNLKLQKVHFQRHYWNYK